MIYRMLLIGLCSAGLSACTGNGNPLAEEQASEGNTINSSYQPTPEPGAKQPSPIQGDWVLVALRQQGESIPVSAEFGVPSLTISLTEGDNNTVKISGYTGVNRLNTSATLSAPQSIMVSKQIVTTRRAGPPAAMNMERQFLQLLTVVDRYRLVGGELQLEAGDTDGVLRFRPDANKK